MGPLPHIMILSPEGAEAVLSSNEAITKGSAYHFLFPWLGQGLLTSSGHKWRKNRKLLTPAFHFKILEDFIPVMNANGRILVNKLESLAKNNNGILDDLRPNIIQCTLDVICETAMGVELNSQRDPDSEYANAVHTVGEIVMDRVFKPWLKSDFVFNLTKDGKKFKQSLKLMHGFTDSVIAKRKSEIEKKMEDEIDINSDNDIKKREPFMDTLIRTHLKDPHEFTLLNIREEVDTFMFEGHDTTAWGVIWSTYLLGLHSECQEKLQAEIDAAYDSKDNDEDLDLEDLKMKLPYTEAVVKEAQRLYPSVPTFSRALKADMKIGKDIVVPAGCVVCLYPRVIHRNPNYWPEPERFIPERFMSNIKRHPYAFIPFSAGPRNCIGQKFAIFEEKALLAKIFRKFKVTSLDQRDRVEVTSSLILKAIDPIRLRLELRT